MQPTLNKSNKISRITYIAYNNTPEARALVVKYGLQPAKNISELQMKLAYVLKNFGDKAKKELALIHPDRAWIIEDTSKMIGSVGGNGEFIYSNCSGCDGKCNCKKPEHSNFDTNMRDQPVNTFSAEGEKAKHDKLMTGLAIAGIFILGVLLISHGEKQRSY